MARQQIPHLPAGGDFQHRVGESGCDMAQANRTEIDADSATSVSFFVGFCQVSQQTVLMGKRPKAIKRLHQVIR
jgi:hypothetical protein